MNRLVAIIYWMAIAGIAWAQSQTEQVTAYTDQDCYLTGERLYVCVDAQMEGKPSLSRVAYVEIADTHRMYAQCMVSLRDGRGWASIELPDQMHSGSYQLTAYTRVSQSSGVYYRTFIGVINGERISRLDDVRFMPMDSCRSEAEGPDAGLELYRCKAGEMIRLPMPEMVTSGCVVSVSRPALKCQIPMDGCSVKVGEPEQKTLACPELEGHIVRAKVRGEGQGEVMLSRLALVGKTATLYDGQRQSDGSYLYYTADISGRQPVMVNAYDTLGRAVPMELVSPYLSVLPERLGRLTVYGQEEELRKRLDAIGNGGKKSRESDLEDLSGHSLQFMSAVPDFFYDLDEYTQMNDVKELLLEFVKGVKRQKYHGVNLLYTVDPETKRYSKWAALVLLDGMPVYDIDEILHYDAHLIRYVQIYSGIFNFGNSCCQGVISFITRKGRLSNYQLKSGESLMSYDFPQEHPATAVSVASGSNTVLWIPVVQGRELQIAAPSVPGQYQITIQGRQATGETFKQIINVQNY